MHGAAPEGRTPIYEPGLEVVLAEYHPDSAVPQASPDASQNDKYAVEPTYQGHDEGIHWHKNEDQQSNAHVGEGQGTRAPVGNTGPSRKKKRWIALAIGALIVIIVAATVGGVVGSRSKETQDEAPEYAANPRISDTANEKTQRRTEKPPENPEQMVGSPTSVAPGLAPTAVSWNPQHFEVWALTPNLTHSVYRKWRNDSSPDEFEPKGLDMDVAGGEIEVDTTTTPSIDVVPRVKGQSRDENRVDVLLVRKGGQLTQTWHSPTQRMRPSHPNTPWFPFDAVESVRLLSAPASVAYEKEGNKMTTFFLSYSGSDTAVWYVHLRKASTWNSPARLNGPDLHKWATPAAVAWNGDSSRLDIFAVSTDNHLQHCFSDDGLSQWSEYKDLGGFVTTPPTVVSRTAGFLDVFVRGGDGGLWHLSLENEKTWSAWRRISGATRIQGQPHAVSSRANSIDVFAWGEEEGAMLHKTYDSVARKWTPSDDGFTTLMPSGLAGPPKGVVVGEKVYVFAYDDQNHIWWQTIGSDKTAEGEPKIWAKVPTDIS